MSNTVKSVNDFVISFLNENNLDSSKWMESSTQTSLKKLVNKSVKGNVQKDPNVPKRGKSAYLFFCSDMRESVKNSLPEDAKATDVTRELGSLWNVLKDDKSRAKELSKYNKLAEEDRLRYQSEIASYKPPENYGVTKKNRDKSGPRRAKSAYLFFCSDAREEVKNYLGDNASATDITKELGKRWNVLKEEKKCDKYETLAREDRERYYREKNQSISEPGPKPVSVPVSEPKVEKKTKQSDKVKTEVKGKVKTEGKSKAEPVKKEVQKKQAPKKTLKK